jgi:hypothetical protein
LSADKLIGRSLNLLQEFIVFFLKLGEVRLVAKNFPNLELVNSV